MSAESNDRGRSWSITSQGRTCHTFCPYRVSQTVAPATKSSSSASSAIARRKVEDMKKRFPASMKSTHSPWAASTPACMAPYFPASGMGRWHTGTSCTAWSHSLISGCSPTFTTIHSQPLVSCAFRERQVHCNLPSCPLHIVTTLTIFQTSNCCCVSFQFIFCTFISLKTPTEISILFQCP